MSASTPNEVMVAVGDLPWIRMIDGIDFRLLFTSGETGRWSVLFRCQPGSFFPAHKHFGAGEYFVLQGRMEYRMGSAPGGTWGYEPLGTVHEMTKFPEYTELLFTNFGPVAFLREDGSVLAMLDNAYLEQLARV